MAVTETLAAEMASNVRRFPITDHGKLRFLYGKATQGVAAGDAGSSFVIGDLPPGRVRVLPYLSRYKTSALAAARVMGIGHDAYYSSSNAGAVAEPANPNVFAAAVDVSAVTDAPFPTTAGMKYDFYSRAGVRLRATITGGTILAGSTAEFNVAYICE